MPNSTKRATSAAWSARSAAPCPAVERERREHPLFGLDWRVGIHRPAHEAPRLDVVEDAHLLAPDGSFRPSHEVYPLHADEIAVTSTVGSTAVATV